MTYLSISDCKANALTCGEGLQLPLNWVHNSERMRIFPLQRIQGACQCLNVAVRIVILSPLKLMLYIPSGACALLGLGITALVSSCRSKIQKQYAAGSLEFPETFLKRNENGIIENTFFESPYFKELILPLCKTQNDLEIICREAVYCFSLVMDPKVDEPIIAKFIIDKADSLIKQNSDGQHVLNREDFAFDLTLALMQRQATGKEVFEELVKRTDRYRYHGTSLEAYKTIQQDGLSATKRHFDNSVLDRLDVIGKRIFQDPMFSFFGLHQDRYGNKGDKSSISFGYEPEHSICYLHRCPESIGLFFSKLGVEPEFKDRGNKDLSYRRVEGKINAILEKWRKENGLQQDEKEEIQNNAQRWWNLLVKPKAVLLMVDRRAIEPEVDWRQKQALSYIQNTYPNESWRSKATRYLGSMHLSENRMRHEADIPKANIIAFNFPLALSVA